MAAPKSREPKAGRDGPVTFGLGTLVWLGLAAAGLAAALTGGAIAWRFRAVEGRALLDTLQLRADRNPAQSAPPWGELMLSDIEVERPADYLYLEAQTNSAERWVFPGTPARARTCMLACGVPAAQVDRALSPALAAASPDATVVTPDEQLVLALSPEVREKLYGELGRCAANLYMQYPFCFEAADVDAWFEESGLDDAVLGLVKRLLYRRGAADCFSDLGIVLRRIPDEEGRRQLLRTLSRQTAVLVRVRIRPETDIDRLLAYWGHGFKTNDVRPVLDSLKRRPGGGSISLLYLLPPFARERLYAFPSPTATNHVPLDCHWSSMNFFQDPPDDRFGDAAYTARFLLANFTVVPKPGRYGDLVLLLDEKGNGIHSAVYLADDLVFTKNGNNEMQSWMIMHLPDLLASYASNVKKRVAVYRDKRW